MAQLENGDIVVHKRDNKILGIVTEYDGLLSVNYKIIGGSRVETTPITNAELTQYFRLATTEEASEYVRNNR